MKTKNQILSIEAAEENLARLESQKAALIEELDGIGPKIEAAREKLVDAVINGDPKAGALRTDFTTLQARVGELELAIKRVHALSVEASLDLKDARNAAYQNRAVELAKDINKIGRDAVKALKTVIELFDRHEVSMEELSVLSSAMKRSGVPQVERERVIQFRRANEILDLVLTEIAAGTLNFSNGKTILDEVGIQNRIDRQRARSDAKAKTAQNYVNGKIGGE